MQDRRARARTGLEKQASPEPATDPRVHVTLEHLRSLENAARHLSFLPRQPAASVLNGRHASRLRGRGLNFEELRNYLPGDDTRTIDWKVTARTGTPHIRVYTEERDRPALLVVDQRMSMFFGTQHAMKSVTAAEAAALAAFRILDQGDRVGGIVFGDDHVAEIRPQRSRMALDRLLKALESANSRLHANAPNSQPMLLNEPLRAVARLARRDHLIFLISDFDGIDADTKRLVSGIARHNDVIMCPVTDPVAHVLPANLKVTVSDGEQQAELDTARDQIKLGLEAFSRGRLDEFLNWQKECRLSIMPLSAGEETLPQIRRLLGHEGGRR